MLRFKYTFPLAVVIYPRNEVSEGNRSRAVGDWTLRLHKGAQADFSQELTQSSLEVLSNPQTQQGHSCGPFFSIKR